MALTPNPDFNAFTLPEEHEMLRAAVRELAEDKIAPRAAEIDETGEFPWDVYEALRANDFHAIHIPEKYGGQGGDALAACLVIEEVARVCASSSLIPAVNKLGTMPLMVGASDEPAADATCPQVASGEAMFSYALSEREAGIDAGSMKCRAVAGDDGWVLNGQKSWISNAGISTYYTVMAVTEPENRAQGASRPSSSTRTTRASPWARRSASSASTARRPARSSSTTAGSRPTGSSASPAPASRPRCAPWTTRA